MFNDLMNLNVFLISPVSFCLGQLTTYTHSVNVLDNT